MGFGGNKTKSFFSVIPIDALNTVWKLCDGQTRYELLLEVFGSFQNDVSELIDQIMVYDGNNMIHNDGTIAINGCDTGDAFRNMLEKFGSSILRLELRFCSPDMKFLFLGRIRTNCPNIRSLFLPLKLWDIEIVGLLSHLGRKLEVLEIESSYESRTKQVVPDLAANCTNLKTFCFTGKGIEHLDRLWVTLGNERLEQVSLRSKFESQYAWEACLDSIKANCRKLNSLALSGPFMGGKKVSGLLISYGEQLKEAVVSEIDVLGALDAAKACSNLRRCIIIEKDAEFRRVKAFGPALQELFLYLDLDSNVSELAQASLGCPDLERLVIECREPVRYVPCLFGSGCKKDRLKVLEMNVEILRGEDMNLIGQSTGNLLSMSIDAVKFEESSHTENIFKEFALRNPDLLRLSVSIATDGTGTHRDVEHEQYIRFASGIADAFRPCRSLESIQISSLKSNLSSPVAPGQDLWRKFSVFHHRRVFVSLFGNRISPHY